MQNFSGNSNAQKKVVEREKLEPITTKSKIKKESEFSKFKKTFFAEDSKTVKQHVFASVIIPGIQRLITESFKTAIDFLFYGGRVDSRKGSGSKISYHPSFRESNRDGYSGIPQSAYQKNIFGYNEVVLFDRGEMEEVLMDLQDRIRDYGSASVADFYELVGQNVPHTAYRYGWRDLSNVEIIRDRDGFSLDLPKAIQLD